MDAGAFCRRPFTKRQQEARIKTVPLTNFMINPNPGRHLGLQAYDGWNIVNWIDADPDPQQVQFNRRNLPRFAKSEKLLGPTTGRYNCFGHVFAARRTNVNYANLQVDIDDLLARDRYKQVGAAQTGDIVLYRYVTGEIEHAGIVSRVDMVGKTPVVFVWSKWGSLEECEHREKLCPYSECKIEYWRLMWN